MASIEKKTPPILYLKNITSQEFGQVQIVGIITAIHYKFESDLFVTL